MGANHQAFDRQRFAIREDTHTDAVVSYVCSPFQCVGHQCRKATCPVGFSGNIHAPQEVITEQMCQEDICDASFPYTINCGVQGGCFGIQGNTVETDSGCYQVDCGDGAFNSSDGMCYDYRCPPNSVQDPETGACRR